MAISTQVVTDEQRKSVALEYRKAFDNAGVTSAGGQHPRPVRGRRAAPWLSAGGRDPSQPMA